MTTSRCLAGLLAVSLIGCAVDGGPGEEEILAVAPGLVAAYAFDEGSGSSAADATGGGHTGTLVNATWSSAGKFGGAASFNGTSSRVTIPDAASLDLTRMTLEAWVRPTATTGGWRTVLLKEQPGELVYALYAGNESNRPEGIIFGGGAERHAIGPSPLPAGTWTHLAATYDGNRVRLYVNGARVGSVAWSGNITASNGVLSIGGNAVWDEWFSGLIDDVRVYDRALTAREIQADMATPVGSTPPTGDTTPPSAPTNLVASAPTQSSVTLSWNAATDDVGVTGYRSYQNGALVATGTATSFTFTGLSCNSSYTLAVEAIDAAGNASTRPSIDATTSACTGGGTIEPGQSWQAAYDAAASGSILTVAAGNHGRPSLVGSKQVTFRGVEGAMVIRMPGDASNVTFENIDVDIGTAHETGGEFSGDNIVLRDVNLYGAFIKIGVGGSNFLWQRGSFGRDGTVGGMRHCQFGDNVGIWVDGDGATFDGIRFNPQDADPTPTPCQPTNGFHYEDVRVQSAQNVTVMNCRFVDGSGVPGNGAGSGHIFITSASPSSTAASGFKLLNTILEPVHGSYTIQIHTNVTSYNAWQIKNSRFDQAIADSAPYVNSVLCGNAGAVPASWKTVCQ